MKKKFSLLLQSNDFRDSIFYGLIKYLISCILILNFREVKQGWAFDEKKVLLISSFQYRKKVLLFKRLASHLNARIIIFGFSWKTSIPLERFARGEVVICSAANYHYRLLVDLLSEKEIKYSAVQHGAFDFADVTKGLEIELQAADGKNYYFWNESDRKHLELYMPSANLTNIKFDALELDKVKLLGIGFATRGREFLKKDIKFLFSHEVFNEVQRIHFHPSYSFLSKTRFILLVFTRFKIICPAPSGSISETLITRSKSMLEALRISKRGD